MPNVVSRGLGAKGLTGTSLDGERNSLVGIRALGAGLARAVDNSVHEPGVLAEAGGISGLAAKLAGLSKHGGNAESLLMRTKLGDLLSGGWSGEETYAAGREVGNLVGLGIDTHGADSQDQDGVDLHIA